MLLDGSESDCCFGDGAVVLLCDGDGALVKCGGGSIDELDADKRGVIAGSGRAGISPADDVSTVICLVGMAVGRST